MNYKSTLKSSVAAAALFAIAAPVAPSANAADDTFKSGNKNSLTMSGYVARGLFYADDGVSEALFNSGGGISSTRLRWIAKGTVNESVTAGAMLEMTLPQSSAQGSLALNNGTSFGTQVDAATATAWGIRHQFVWVNHKKMGKISLGQTNAASNGRSETTFSGVNMADDSSASNMGDGIRFIETTNAAPSISAVTVGTAFSNLDGRGRDDVVRYDSPRFSGLAVAVSAIRGGDWDIGLDYQGKNGAIKYRVQGQYNNNSATSTTVDGSVSASAAFLHDSGLNGAVAWGRESRTGAATAGFDDQKFYWFDVGYRAKIFGIGGTNFSFNLNETSNRQLAVNNSDATAVGFTIAQLFDPIGSNMAVSYKNYSFDTDTGTFNDIDVISLQTVFNF